MSFVSVLNLLQLVSFSVQFFLSFFFSLSRSCYVSGPCPCLVAVNEISLVSSVFFFWAHLFYLCLVAAVGADVGCLRGQLSHPPTAEQFPVPPQPLLLLL